MATWSAAEVARIHAEALVFDGHNDTPVERVARGEAPLQWMTRDPSFHADVPRMRAGGYDGGVFIVGNGAVADLWVTTERVLSQVEAHGDVLALALTAGDVQRAKAAGRIAVLMGIEGAGRWLRGHVEVVAVVHRLGIRLLGLTHGEGGPEPGMLQASRSPFGPCTAAERDRARREAGGLTDFGREVLAASNRSGLVTDLAHINDRAFYEVLELSSSPPIASHTAVCALCPHWRCLTDDQIRALAAAGGVLGIAFAPMFIDERAPTVRRLVEHVRHAVDLVGVDHVGIGTDFDGLGDRVPVIPDVAGLPALTAELLAAGFGEAEVKQIWGGNFLRVLRQALGA